METDYRKINPKLTNPLLFVGSIAASSDFPLLSSVKNGWFYTLTADVTDNNPAKTNTGQSFLNGDEIAWNGTNWTVLGNRPIQATESVLGIAKIATQAIVENELNTDNDDIVSPQKFWFGILKFLTRINTWTAQQTFNSAPILNSLKGKAVLGTDIDGKIVDNTLIEFFDATIGAGGQFPDIISAHTAGKYRLKAVGNITMQTDTTLIQNVFLDLNGYTLICSTYVFINSQYLTIQNGTITTAVAVNKVLFDNAAVGSKLKVTHSGAGVFADYGIWTDISITLGASSISFGLYTVMGFDGTLIRIEIIGTNTSTFACSVANGTCEDITIKGSWAGGTCYFYLVTTSNIMFKGLTCTQATGTLYVRFQASSLGQLLVLDNVKATTCFFNFNSQPNCGFLSGFIVTNWYELGSSNNVTMSDGIITNYTPYSAHNHNQGFTKVHTLIFTNPVTLYGYYSVFIMCRFNSTLTVLDVSNVFSECVFVGNVVLAGSADSTRLSGQIAGTIQLSAGVINCKIDVGVYNANNILGSDGNPYISGVNGDPSNQISYYILT